jgi:hypothetical protein
MPQESGTADRSPVLVVNGADGVAALQTLGERRLSRSNTSIAYNVVCSGGDMGALGAG